MRKLIIPAITLAILLSGCWDLTESEKLGLVTLMGIDSSGDGQIRVLIHEMSSQAKASGGQKESVSEKAPVKLHEAVGPTISEAIEKIAAADIRRTYFAHTGAIILSDGFVSSNGIGPFVDFLERMPEIRRNTWLLVSVSNQFDSIFSTGTKIEPGVDTGKIVTEIIKNKPANSFLTANTLGDFLNLFWEIGSEPYTSGIELNKINIDDKNAVTSKDETDDYDLSIENTAVFKNGRLAGWLNNYESMGLLWAKGQIKGGNISVNLDNKMLTLKIVRMNAKTKPGLVAGKPRMGINIEVISNISESQANLDFENISLIKRIQELQSEEIKKQITAALDKSRSLDSDVFSFGNYLFGRYPKYWKQMIANGYDYYHDIKVNVNIKSTINQIGLTRKAQKSSLFMEMKNGALYLLAAGARK